MSERIAKTHHNQSNRAKPQESSTDRKSVYKSVLDNPFKIQWPNVAVNIQNSLVARIVSMLEGVAEYQSVHHAQQRKRKREEKSQSRKSRKTDRAGADEQLDNHLPAATDRSNIEEPMETATTQPPILQHVIVGVNQVTKDLEGVAHTFRESLSAEASKTVTPKVDVHARLVLVCREDIDPPILVAHFPNLVAACNSARHRINHAAVTWLVPLSKGSENALAGAIGLRRASVLVIKDSAPGFPELNSLLESVPVLSASWLSSPTTTQQYQRTLIPTHIKQLRTTAPKDMKATKEKRARERAVAKARSKTTAWKPKKIPKRTKLTTS